MHALSVEVSGRERDHGEALKELVVSAGTALDYEDMRSTLAERYHGWTFDYIDGLDFDRIVMAWRHLCGKTKREPPPLLPGMSPPRTWRDFLDELLPDDKE